MSPAFVKITDVDGKQHVVQRTAITSVAPMARPDGHSFSQGAVVRMSDSTAIRIYERERDALEAVLLADCGRSEERGDT